MDDFEILLEQTFKEYTYRKDGSPLAELQYNIRLLAHCIEDMLKIVYRPLEERVENFEAYRNKYFEILNNTLKEFTEIRKSKDVIDKKFVNSINTYTETLMLEYDLKIEYLSQQEALTINETVVAYQILLRGINTYIKCRNPNLKLINIKEI